MPNIKKIIVGVGNGVGKQVRPVRGEYRPSASNFTLSNTYTGYLGSGIDFNNDGTLMFLAQVYNTYSCKIEKHQLSTPYDISTSTLLDTTTLNNARGEGISIRDNGTFLYLPDEAADKYKQYTLSTPYDVNTATVTNSISTPSNYGYETYMAKDGKHMYIGNGYISSFVAGYELSTDWDITTATEVGSRLTSSIRDAFGYGFCVKDDGTYAYITIGGITYSGALSTPYVMSTFTSDGQFANVGRVFYDGRKNLFMNNGQGTIYHYIAN